MRARPEVSHTDLMKQALTLVGLCLALSFLAAGCGSEDAKMSKDDQTNFKGKPMPADVKAQMMKGAGGPPAAGLPPAGK